MSCEETRSELLNYIRGPLKRRKAAAVEKHIDICRDCRRIVESYRNVWQDLGELEIAPPKKLRAVVENRVMQYVTPPAPISKAIPRWVYTVAASLLAILCVWYYMHGRDIPAQAAKAHLLTTISHKNSDELEVRKMAKDLLKTEPHLITPRDTSLLGGEICRLNKMVVAQITYQYQGIPISLFIWDKRWKGACDGIPANIGHPVAFRRQGISVVVWERKSLIYCLAADLEPAELAAVFGLPAETQYSP